MNALIVHKSSNYELHKGRFSTHVSGYDKAEEDLHKLQVAHEEHYSCLDVLKQELRRAKIQFTELLRGSPWPTAKFDLVITVGGDGTLLTCSQQMPNGGKIVGIRSSGSSIGYLCASATNGVGSLVDRLASGKQDFLEVMRLRAKVIHVDRSGEILTPPVLNDILYANTSPAATSRYKIGVEDQWEIQKSSGVWISTAAGSTAAIAAAGGRVLKFTDAKAQYHVRELYRPKGRDFKLASGVFDPKKTRLRIENRSESALIALDGQHGEVNLNFGDIVEVLDAPSQMIARPDHMIATPV